MSFFRVTRQGKACRSRTVAVVVYLVAIGWALGVWTSESQANGVQKLDDVHFGVWSPFVKRWTQRSAVCITGDGSGGIFKLVATGQTPGQTYALTNDINTRVGYRLFWHTGPKYRQRERLTSGTTTRKVYTYSTAPSCSDGPTGMLRVLLDQGELEAAVPAVYSDTLLLMVVPQ